VSKAERAWFLSRRERRAKPVSERDFLAGEILHVFKLLSLSFPFAGCFSSALVLILKKRDD
jgi:hypothetical protein